MKLTKLIVQGFKSFKDRTTIHFDQGITGIVGPNGCGKSNIVDALFWVMGEQSAKHLRGNSMKDLIFAGSSKHTPGSFAEATLVLANTEGKHIHIGNKVASPSEIQLTRKLFRNGETEYRINGSPCRLKDIQEVFMDTGAGAKAYSIIAQGEINRLVQAKPVERRNMIEDVAGITKFKLRRRESVRKIEATQSNLERLSDLKSEVGKNLASLRKQAEKADHARKLKEKVRKNELVVTSHKVFDFLRHLTEDHTIVSEKKEIIENGGIEKEELENSLKEERVTRKEMNSEVEELQNQINEISKQLAAEEERYNFLKNSIGDKQKQISQREEELEDQNQELENRKVKLTELKEKEDELLKQKEEGFDFSDLEAEVESLSTQIADNKEKLSDEERSFEELNEKLNELNQTKFRNNSKLEEFSTTLQDLTSEIEVLEEQVSGFSKTMADERNEANRLTNEANELDVRCITLKEKLDELKSLHKEKETNVRANTKELIQTQSRLESLQEIKKSLEGAREGTNEFLNQEEGENFSLLGNLIQCEDKFTKSVQFALRDMVNSLVPKTDLEGLKTWCAENSEMGIDFISPFTDSLNFSESRERLELKGFKIEASLDEIVTLPAEYGHLNKLFGGIFVVESLGQDLVEKLEPSMRFRAMVTLDGKETVRNIDSGLQYYRESESSESMGMVERNNLIAELEIKVSEMQETLEAGEAALTELEEQVTNIATDYDDARTMLSERKADAAAKNSALESKTASMESGNSRLDILKNRKKDISQKKFDLIEDEDKLNKELEDISAQTEERKERVQFIKDQNDELSPLFEEKRSELFEKQAAASSFEQGLKSTQEQIEDLKSQLERIISTIEKNTDTIEEVKLEIEEIEATVKELADSNFELKDKIETEKVSLKEKKAALQTLQKEMSAREDRIKKLVNEINQAEKKVVELEAKREQYLDEEEFIVRDIFEKYLIDLRRTIGEFLEYKEEDYSFLKDTDSMYDMKEGERTIRVQAEDYEFNRRYGQDLKDCEFRFKQNKHELKRLGEINWQAIEDYERQKLRFDFLEVQEDELKKSLEDLDTAINHIDVKSKERFKIAFEEVNMRFEKVFPLIFGGGSAQLKIVGDVNDPDCGIEIIAQPPGKKMQNINLMSGGEKALTALSLIFSIFLVKPAPFCLLDEVDAPLDDANVGRFNELLREMSSESQFILITHNKKTMELNDTLYGVTMQEPGVSKAVSVQLH